MSRTKRLTAFTQSYAQAAVVIPFALVSPAYFANKIQLGALTQTAEAFGQVQDALSFFVTAYRTMAEWRAVVARLDGFESAIATAPTSSAADPGSIDSVATPATSEISLPQLLVKLPNGKPLVSADGISAFARRTHAPHRTVGRPANRRCSAPSPASGRSARARSTFPPMHP